MTNVRKKGGHKAALFFMLHKDHEKHGGGMSRWVDAFNAHGFQAAWGRVKESTSLAEADKSVAAQVEELARFKKAIAFLDEIVGGVDPELVPMAIWDSFRDQANACADQVNSFNSSKNVGHLQQANGHADHLLSYARPYLLAKGKAARALQSALSASSSAVRDFAKGLSEERVAILSKMSSDGAHVDRLLLAATSASHEIEEKHKSLFTPGAGGLSAYEEVTQKFSEINAYHAQLVAGNEDELSIRQQVAQAKSAVEEGRENVSSMIVAAKSSISELEKFHAKIFGAKDESGARQGGLSSELDARISAMAEFEDLQKVRYSALNEQIESLLPGATSAGLATAYKELKESFDGPIRNANRLFYLSVAVLVVGSLFLSVKSVGLWWIELVPFGDWKDVLKAMVYKLPFYGPALWLAFYATKRRSEFQRLQQEYAHKEALAKSYDSYRKQIKELSSDDSGLLQILIAKSIDAIAYNASATLDGKHGDKMPSQEVLEKLVAAAMAEARK